MKKPVRHARKRTLWAAVWLMIPLCFQLAGCSGIGPRTVSRDRFDYVSAISESWKRQTLLNLLKTRYMDAPVFLDVGSVINQYAVEGQIQFGFSWDDLKTQTVGGSGKYTDRPTITYSPLMGERFSRSLMTPIPIPGILFLLQAGYSADYVFRICVQTINGIQNKYGGAISGRVGDPEFYELMTLLRDVQMKGGMGMRIQAEGEKEAVVMYFRPAEDKTIARQVNRIGALLGLDRDAREFSVVYGAFASNDREIGILSRSMLQVMVQYASYIDVPASDVTEGRVGGSNGDKGEAESRFPPLIRVQNDVSKPDGAYVAVRYRDRWFWIDDRDFISKSTFYFLMLLFSLTERGGGQGAPIVTVPTN